MSLHLSEFDGEQIYLDTMLPYLLLREADEEIRLFFSRLEKGEFTAFTSVLTFDELAYRLVLALIRDHYDGSPLDQLRNNERERLSEFSPAVNQLLQQLLRFPNLTIAKITSQDIASMGAIMEQYPLRPRDALHLATIQRVGCLTIASSDSHFDQIPNLQRFTT